jgi:hypothetical protein
MMPWDKKSAGTLVLLVHIHKHGKQQDYCSVGYARVVERSEKFDSIKYQDL